MPLSYTGENTMDANLTTAIISASATALVAITALLVNNKRFDDMGARMNDLNSRMTRLETKLDHIESMLVGYCLDVARIKERLDIK
jgi:outer membrane murein-binding lipoprotein Lpp